MSRSNHSGRSRAHRAWAWSARGALLRLAVILSTLAILLHGALGARRAVVALRLSPPAVAVAVGIATAASSERDGTLAQDSANLDGDGADDSDGSEADDDSSDADDVDEMIVQRWSGLPRASFYELFWHETPCPEGVIHSPEPRPARIG